jgi:hypothetical protein
LNNSFHFLKLSIASYDEIWSPAREMEMSTCQSRQYVPRVTRAIRSSSRELPFDALLLASVLLSDARISYSKSDNHAMTEITVDVAQVRCVTLPQDLKHILPVLLRSLESDRRGENADDKDRDTHDKNAEGEPQEGEAKWREVAGERNCKEKQHPSVERVA